MVKSAALKAKGAKVLKSANLKAGEWLPAKLSRWNRRRIAVEAANVMATTSMSRKETRQALRAIVKGGVVVGGDENVKIKIGSQPVGSGSFNFVVPALVQFQDGRAPLPYVLKLPYVNGHVFDKETAATTSTYWHAVVANAIAAAAARRCFPAAANDDDDDVGTDAVVAVLPLMSICINGKRMLLEPNYKHLTADIEPQQQQLTSVREVRLTCTEGMAHAELRGLQKNKTMLAAALKVLRVAAESVKMCKRAMLVDLQMLLTYYKDNIIGISLFDATMSSREALFYDEPNNRTDFGWDTKGGFRAIQRNFDSVLEKYNVH